MNRRRVSTPSLPYASATSGKRAIISIHKILEVFGASDIGVMETSDGVLAQFKWRERVVMIRASAVGYAAAWLRRHPHSHRMRTIKIDYERRALLKGRTAVYSILRDWIKGQITAVEVGMLSFEGAFLGQIMLPTGETVLERVERNDMLSLPPPSATH